LYCIHIGPLLLQTLLVKKMVPTLIKAARCRKCHCDQCHFSFCTRNNGVVFDRQCHFPNPAAFIEVNAVFGSLTKFCSKKWSSVDTIQSSTYERVVLFFHTTPTSKSYNHLAAVSLPSCCRLAAVSLRSCVNCPEARSR
jgi:hypothetical protein